MALQLDFQTSHTISPMSPDCQVHNLCINSTKYINITIAWGDYICIGLIFIFKLTVHVHVHFSTNLTIIVMDIYIDADVSINIDYIT